MYPEPYSPNRYLLNTPSSSCRIHIFFPSACGKFFSIDHTIGDKHFLRSNLLIEIIKHIFCDDNLIKIEINDKTFGK
jgi:hypothetical protein